MECVIYNIITKDGLYIGSTNNFKRRCWEHKSRVKSGDSQLLYKNITKNNGQYKIEIILELVCEDKLELRKIENVLQQQTINSNIILIINKLTEMR